MRWNDHDKQQLRTLYLEERLPIAEIAQRLSRTTASVNTILTSFGIPRLRSLPRLRMPTSITPALARIHAHVCGDGHLIHNREKDCYGYLAPYRQGYYRWRYGVGYTNTKRILIDAFIADVREVFNLQPRYEAKNWMVTVKSKPVWELLKRLGAGKSRSWFIGEEIRVASRVIQATWLHAFFDDEAHFDPQGRIRVRSVNRQGLEQAASMLRLFVPCHLTPQQGLYPDHSCYLVVSARSRNTFFQLIGSSKFPQPIPAKPTEFP